MSYSKYWLRFLLIRGLYWASAFLFLVWAAMYSLTTAINAPTFHLDGAFQTASGLIRIDSGQFPGKDFFPYLGIGPLLTLYPAFKLFGSNLSSSVFSAQFMTLLLGWFSASTTCQLIVRPRSITVSILVGAVFLVVPIAIANYGSFKLDQSLAFASNPGNSLRPIRAVLPYFAAIAFYFFR